MKFIYKILRFVLIFSIILAWTFNFPPAPFLKNFGGQGWPQIWQNPPIPPEIKVTQAAHTLDTSAQNNDSVANPRTFTYTAGAGSTVLVLHIMYAGTTARTGGAPTYNGITLTQLDSTRSAAESTIEVWYLIDPPAGAYTMSIPNANTRVLDTLTATAKAQSGYTSVLDVVTGKTNQLTANPTSTITTTANGDFITFWAGHGAAAPGTGNKSQYGGVWGYDSGAFNYMAQYELQALAGQTTHQFTVAADDWSAILASFKEVRVTYNQSAYRWFQNTDSAGVGIALANQDASSTINASDDFRLRLLLHVGDATSSPGTADFKLQVASTTLSNCTSTLSGFVDVGTASGYIRYLDNSIPNDGDLLTASSSDPSHNGHTTANQTYEEVNNFTVTSTIGLAKDGQWDFSLKAYSAPQETAFCFKVVKSDDSSNLNGGYTKVPEIDIAVAAATISCSTNITSTSLGALTASAVSTSTPNASTTMSCANTNNGCTLYINDTGGGSPTQPGLWNATSSKLIPSPNASFSATTTLATSTEGYGIRATSTGGGSGTLNINSRYLQAGSWNVNTVGGLATTTITLASSTADVTNRETVVTHKAAASSTTPGGTYNDTITYSCFLN